MIWAAAGRFQNARDFHPQPQGCVDHLKLAPLDPGHQKAPPCIWAGLGCEHVCALAALDFCGPFPPPPPASAILVTSGRGQGRDSGQHKGSSANCITLRGHPGRPSAGRASGKGTWRVWRQQLGIKGAKLQDCLVGQARERAGGGFPGLGPPGSLGPPKTNYCLQRNTCTYLFGRGSNASSQQPWGEVFSFDSLTVSQEFLLK